MNPDFLRDLANNCAKQYRQDVDVTEELKDLLNVYTDAEVHLKRKEDEALSYMTTYVKRYIDAKEERQKVSEKLHALQRKLADNPSSDDEDEGEDDE